MAKSFLSDSEIAFLEELVRLKVKFMVVGMSAAILQGSDRGTEDIDLWFQSLSDPNVDKAARKAGGILAWRANPIMVSGKNLANIDIVYKCDGLGSFEKEYEKAIVRNIHHVPVKVLPLERVIASKEASGRPKDLMALPSLKATVAANRKYGSKSPK